MEYDSSNHENANDIEIDININDVEDKDDIDIDININDGQDVVELDEISCNEPAVLAPDMLQNLMYDYYAEKSTTTQIPIEMGAAIELLPY